VWDWLADFPATAPSTLRCLAEATLCLVGQILQVRYGSSTTEFLRLAANLTGVLADPRPYFDRLDACCKAIEDGSPPSYVPQCRWVVRTCPWLLDPGLVPDRSPLECLVSSLRYLRLDGFMLQRVLRVEVLNAALRGRGGEPQHKPVGFR